LLSSISARWRMVPRSSGIWLKLRGTRRQLARIPRHPDRRFFEPVVDRGAGLAGRRHNHRAEQPRRRADHGHAVYASRAYEWPVLTEDDIVTLDGSPAEVYFVETYLNSEASQSSLLGRAERRTVQPAPTIAGQSRAHPSATDPTTASNTQVQLGLRFVWCSTHTCASERGRK
jgi:hypothetical protein